MITNNWFVVCGDWTVKAIIYIGKMENGEGGYCCVWDAVEVMVERR